MIADEVALPLRRGFIKNIIDPDSEITDKDLTVEKLATKLQEKWNVIVLLVDNGTARRQESEAFYSNLFGVENVLPIQDPHSISELIGALLGKLEGDNDDTKITKDLVEAGVSQEQANVVSKVISKVEGKGALATTTLDLTENSDTEPEFA